MTFSAADARDLVADISINAEVAAALELVRKAAEQGKFKCQLRSSLFTIGAQGNTDAFRKAKYALESLGYRINVRYVELQLVDIYTEIDWESP